MLEVSTVQYLSNNTESGIDNYSDSSSNETIKKGDAVNKKDAKEIFQTSPSVRDYYGRGHIGVGDNVRSGQNSNKELLNTQTESNTNTSITTTKYTQEKFDLDYEEYSDDTSFFFCF
jgi:acetyltransferase-like isoleucine patch superfamily enzyme